VYLPKIFSSATYQMAASSDVSDFKTAVDPEKERLMLSSDLSSVVKRSESATHMALARMWVQGLLILRTGLGTLCGTV
jgi:hypothetical protein